MEEEQTVYEFTDREREIWNGGFDAGKTTGHDLAVTETNALYDAGVKFGAMTGGIVAAVVTLGTVFVMYNSDRIWKAIVNKVKGRGRKATT